MGRRHTAYGVIMPDYQSAADALLWTLEQGLGADFTVQTKDAWVAAYTLLSSVMQAGADYPYANFSLWKSKQR